MNLKYFFLLTLFLVAPYGIVGATVFNPDVLSAYEFMPGADPVESWAELGGGHATLWLSSPLKLNESIRIGDFFVELHSDPHFPRSMDGLGTMELSVWVNTTKEVPVDDYIDEAFVYNWSCGTNATLLNCSENRTRSIKVGSHYENQTTGGWVRVSPDYVIPLGEKRLVHIYQPWAPQLGQRRMDWVPVVDLRVYGEDVVLKRGDWAWWNVSYNNKICNSTAIDVPANTTLEFPLTDASGYTNFSGYQLVLGDTPVESGNQTEFNSSFVPPIRLYVNRSGTGVEGDVCIYFNGGPEGVHNMSDAYSLMWENFEANLTTGWTIEGGSGVYLATDQARGAYSLTQIDEGAPYLQSAYKIFETQTGNFTIEFWQRAAQTNREVTAVIDDGDVTEAVFGPNMGSNGQFRYYVTSWNDVQGYNINQWYHHKLVLSTYHTGDSRFVWYIDDMDTPLLAWPGYATRGTTNSFDRFRIFENSEMGPGWFDDIAVYPSYNGTDEVYPVAWGVEEAFDLTPPNITIDSPTNTTYVSNNVDLNLTNNDENPSWMGYNLDGAGNVTLGEVNDTGLVSRWPFVQGSGSTALDVVGGNDGTITGASWTTGILGNALSFDGGTQFVEVASDSSLDSESFSTSFWFNSEQLRIQGILGKWLLPNSVNSWRVFMSDTNGVIDFDAQGEIGNVATGNTVVGAWYHYVATYDAVGDDIVVYLDGSQVNTGSTGGVGMKNNVSGSLKIGGRTGDNYFNGSIDDVRVFNRSLTPGQVASLYNLTRTNRTLTGFSDGPHNVIVYANDSNGNLNTSQVFFSVNAVLDITIISPENTSYATTTISLNMSNDTVVDAWLYEYDSNGTNISFTPNTTFTAAGGDGPHHINVWANDSGGVWASATAYFTVDTTPPTITITLPGNTSYLSPLSVGLNTSADEATDTWIYSLNGGGNNTYSPNTTITASIGSNNIVVWANDTAGNWATATAYFTTDNVTVINIGPVNDSTQSAATIGFIYFPNSSQYTWANASFYLDGSRVAGNSTALNNVANNTINYTFAATGNFTWYVEACTAEAGCVTSPIWDIEVSDGNVNIRVFDEATLALANDSAYVALLDPGNYQALYSGNATNGTITFQALARDYVLRAGHEDTPTYPYRRVRPITVAFDVNGNYTGDVYTPPLSSTVVLDNLVLNDLTGDFPPSTTLLRVKRYINSSAAVMHAEYFDIENKVPVYLIVDARYQITLLTATEERIHGWFIPESSGDVTIAVSARNYTLGQSIFDLVNWTISEGSIIINFNDGSGGPTSVTVRMWNETDSNGTLLFTGSSTAASSSFSYDPPENMSIKINIDASTGIGPYNTTFVYDYFVGVDVRVSVGLGDSGNAWLRTLIVLLLVGFTSLAFTEKHSGVGAIATVGVLGFGRYIGWINVGGMAMGLLIFMAFLAFVRRDRER